MTIKTLIAAAALTALSTSAFAAGGYNPGYSTSDVRLAQKEAQAVASGSAIGTHGVAVIVNSADVYTPGYSANDLKLIERSEKSTHTLPYTEGKPGTALIDDPA
ncbi:hypothetical protein [Methylobrevis albus]|uniref:DUF4148 domain-containing protein n=1 Tax=Methylobrevis albus TaxID=2793297 RepID=A0A931I1W7_9HYPH|nr:hypothetical protein [Methylobrevis albus]MBH0237426.1 hypothetical protein [Methylobrevis albus]